MANRGRVYAESEAMGAMSVMLRKRRTMIAAVGGTAVLLLIVVVGFVFSGSAPVVLEPIGDSVALIGDSADADQSREEREESVPAPPPVDPLAAILVGGPALAPTTADDLTQPLAATGGREPYQWRVEGMLPVGVALEDATLRGRPEVPGTFEFEVVVLDADGREGRVPVRWNVAHPLMIEPILPAGGLVAGTRSEVVFQIEGGTEPFVVRVDAAGLAAGLSYEPDVLAIVGTPAFAQRFRLSVTVTDSEGRTASYAKRLEVAEAGTVMLLEQPGGDDASVEDDLTIEPALLEGASRGGIVGWGNQEADRALTARLNVLNEIGLRRLAARQLEQAIRIFETIVEADDQHSVAQYNLACGYALLNLRSRAIDALRAAVRAGFTDAEHMRADDDLANLREEPAFREIVDNEDELRRLAAEGRLALLSEQFPGYLTQLDEEHKFIFATNQSQFVLDMLTARLTTFAEVVWREMGWRKPDYYVMIVLPSAEDFARLRPAPNVGGWYNSRQKMLICGNIGHVLMHEFTHALHFADLGARGQSHQIWFIEGLGTVFENVRLPRTAEDPLEPVPNGRIFSARTAVERANLRIPWRQFMSLNQRQFMPNPQRTGFNYATSRYICMYLHQTGKLRAFYDAYAETFEPDVPDASNGIAAWEQVFGKPLEEIEADWREWMLDLDLPANRGSDVAVVFGLTVSDIPDSTGVRIRTVAPGSPAQTAGLGTSDVLVEIDRQLIDSVGALRITLGAYAPGDTIEVVLIRTVFDNATGRDVRRPVTMQIVLTAR